MTCSQCEIIEHASDLFSAERVRTREQQRIVGLERLVGRLTLSSLGLARVQARGTITLVHHFGHPADANAPEGQLVMSIGPFIHAVTYV